MTQKTDSFSGKFAAIAASLLSTTAIAMTNAVSSQAATFTPFSFQTNISTSGVYDPTKDVRLDSIVTTDEVFSQFELVNRVEVLQDDEILASGRGPNSVADLLVGEGPATIFPTESDLAASLNNLNLTSLVITREEGSTASFKAFFPNPVNTFFFWERGGTPGSSVAGNSDLLVEALDSDGETVLASYKILRSNYTNSGVTVVTDVQAFQVGPQNLGSIGLRLDDGATKTLRLTSSNNNLGALGGDNGPDFKVVAAVPEPFTMTGALVAGGLGLMLKKRKKVTAG
uniref:PEP-CTERM sorting domain-containing protein n=1 Tax=Oscillatoriales cyanobacterium SpSt-402 TaxID=2282168 RepID=A0A832GYV5_9CYAN